MKWDALSAATDRFFQALAVAYTTRPPFYCPTVRLPHSRAGRAVSCNHVYLTSGSLSEAKGIYARARAATISSQTSTARRQGPHGPSRGVQSFPRDAAEREAVLARHRARYEQALRLNRRDLRQWMRYAQVEIDSRNIDRARSIFERALAVDYTYVPLWLRYAQMELLLRQFSHARAVYDRGVTLLPQEQKLWLSYIEMEELLDNLDADRSIFERWTLSSPDVAWRTWYHFEKNNKGNPLEILERWVVNSPQEMQAWILLARESDPRSAYSRAIDTDMLATSDRKEILKRWAEYETSKGEDARAEALLQLGGIDQQVEAFLNLPYRNVESWWIEISLRISSMGSETVARMFETATERCVPHDKTRKTLEWRKYALLWLRYAIFAEKHMLPVGPIFDKALAHWPHEAFTSATLWNAYAEYEIRQSNVGHARKVYGSALGKTRGRSSRIFEDYISLEKRLLSTDKVRLLYAKYCEEYKDSNEAWLGFANFEASLEEYDRARVIFKLATAEVSPENSDSVWFAWAEMEADCGEFDRARDVWNAALAQKLRDPVNAWSQFAMFEISTGLGDDEDEVDSDAIVRARSIIQRAFSELKDRNTERLELYDLSIQFEETYGTEESLESVRQKAPRVIHKQGDHGQEWYEYEFQKDEPSAISKLLANARKWAESNNSST